MIYSAEKIQSQIELLLNKYHGLRIAISTESVIRLNGKILVYRVYNDFPVYEEFSVDIEIPLGEDSIPTIFDTGKQILESYPHRYPDGKLCLATDTEIKLAFEDGYTLLDWMENFVEPYFYSYKYYLRFHTFPFGERSHGHLGTLETYQDIFCVASTAEAFKLMSYVVKVPYRGHHLCPCNSGKKIRNCHGEKLLPFYLSQRKRTILHNDYKKISLIVG